jgi:hypothetical protein
VSAGCMRPTWRPTRAGVAVGLSRPAAVPRPSHGRAPPPPPARDGPAAGGAGGGATGGPDEAGDVPLAAPLVRDAPSRVGPRHPDDPGAAGPSGREHDHDLHARPEQGRPRGEESAGPGWAWWRRSVGAARRDRARSERGVNAAGVQSITPRARRWRTRHVSLAAGATPVTTGTWRQHSLQQNQIGRELRRGADSGERQTIS